MTMKSISRM